MNEDNDKVLVPNWLIKSLAWAFIVAMLAWGSYLQVQADTGERIDAEQNTKIAETQIEYKHIHEQLTRIEMMILTAKGGK